MKDGDPRPYHTAVILMQSELAEALEDWRAHKRLDEIWHEGASHEIHKKPCGIPIELADFVIRVCQRCGTDGNGGKLDEYFVAQATSDDVGLYSDFEELLAELNLSASLSYMAATTRGPEKIQKMEVLEYLAEALAELFVFCEKNAIDLWAAIDMKEAYNRTRSHRHGGKKV